MPRAWKMPISLGEQGLAYAGKTLPHQCSQDLLSTIAAGDSVLAGYIYGYLQGWTKMEMLKTAAAFGTAACFTPGTLPPQRGVIARLKEEMEAICYPA